MAVSSHALITLADAKSYLGVVDDDRDRVIERLVDQASAVINRESGTQWRPLETGTTRRFPYAGAGVVSLAPFVMRALVGVRLDPGGVAPRVLDPTGVQLRPIGGEVVDTLRLASDEPALGAVGGLGVVEVVGDWGAAEVPADIERCAYRLVELWFRSEIAFTSEEYGDVPALPQGIPLDVRDILRAYRPAPFMGAV